MRWNRTFLCGLALAGFTLGCKSSEPAKSAEPARTAEPAAPAAATPPAKAGPSDAQIAAIVVAANQVDIDAGEQAARKSKHPEVTKLARLMITDHTAVNAAAAELVTRLGVKPEESDASRGLVSGGASTRATLDGLDGAAFDKAYVDNEVAYHEEVIRVVDQTLIPAAQNAELKKMLVDVKPALQAHLEHARGVQASLAGTAAAGHAGH